MNCNWQIITMMNCAIKFSKEFKTISMKRTLSFKKKSIRPYKSILLNKGSNNNLITFYKKQNRKEFCKITKRTWEFGIIMK